MSILDAKSAAVWIHSVNTVPDISIVTELFTTTYLLTNSKLIPDSCEDFYCHSGKRFVHLLEVWVLLYLLTLVCHEVYRCHVALGAEINVINVSPTFT